MVSLAEARAFPSGPAFLYQFAVGFAWPMALHWERHLSFHLHRFLRSLPRPALRDYLEDAATKPGDDIDWEAPDEAYLDSVIAAVESLPDKRHEQVWADFETADVLGKDNYGRNAMRSVIRGPENLQQFDALEDTRACALWLVKTDRALFEKGLAAHYADRYSNGRSWGAYQLDGVHSLTDGPDAREAFQHRLTGAMNLDRAKGRLLVDWFERDIREAGAGDSDVPRRVVQAAIYREEAPRCELTIDDENSVRARVSRPVAEAALVFDPAGGEIDIVCKGGRKLLERLCRVFCETMLGAESPPVPRRRPEISFRPLMSRPVFARQPEDRVRAVEVELLRLRSDRAGGLCLTLECKGSDGPDLYEQAQQVLGERSPIGRPGWEITHARLRVYFEPKGDGRPLSVAFDLYVPNRCNLREQTEQHRLILRELLFRWGIYERTP